MDKVKFYTHYDRPACDCESYKPGTSITVPDQVEPVSVTVARCLRGEVLANANEKPTYYEFEGDVNIDDVNFDQTTSPGFDLADVPSLLESAVQADQTASQEAVAEPNKAKETTEVKTESQTSTNVDEE